MTDPRRLVDERNLGATLLASAGSDAPGRRGRQRVAAALGLAASIATLTSASSVAGSMGAVGTPTAAKLGAGAAGSRVGATAWLTLIGGGLVAAALAGSLIMATSEGNTRQPAAVIVSTMPPATSAAAPAADPVAASEPPTVATPRDTTRQGGPDQVRSKASHANADPSAESPLARELRSLDAARSSLDRREIADALVALDRYDRAFPNGALRTEASLLRVEALIARGDGAEARRLARDLLAHDPSGPHARRLRTIVDNQ